MISGAKQKLNNYLSPSVLIRNAWFRCSVLKLSDSFFAKNSISAFSLFQFSKLNFHLVVFAVELIVDRYVLSMFIIPIGKFSFINANPSIYIYHHITLIFYAILYVIRSITKSTEHCIMKLWKLSLSLIKEKNRKYLTIQ